MYSKNFEIKNEHTKDGKLKIAKLIEFMLETSIMDTHFEEKMVNVSNVVWVVYSWNFDVIDNIFSGDNIEITTWISDVNRLKFNREFLVKRNAQAAVKCSSEFILLDFYNRKPIYPNNEMLKDIVFENNKLVNENIVVKKPVKTVKSIQVESKDFDKNGHVNNTVYMRWIEDIYNYNFGKDLKKIKLVYSKEIDTLKKVDIKFSEESDYFEITSDIIHAKGFIS